MVDQCDNCLFYRIRSLPVMGEGSPAPVLLPECRYSDPWANGTWPQVKPDDWCGKWEAIPATAGREYRDLGEIPL